MVDSTPAPSGLQINYNEIQINPGKIMVPTTPTPPVDEIEMVIDPGMAAPLATPAAPCGLQVNFMNLFTTLKLEVKFVLTPGPR